MTDGKRDTADDRRVEAQEGQAPESNVHSTRPLNLTSDVVLRPRGPLDSCIAELESAVSYVAARVGGTIVLDCTDLTAASELGAAAVTTLLDRVRTNSRVIRLVHVAPDLQRQLDCPTVLLHAEDSAELGRCRPSDGVR